MGTQAVSTVFRVRGGQLAVWLHTRQDPSPEEWDRGIDQLLQLNVELRRVKLELKTLVLSDGGAPNALQRKRMAEHFPGARAAVITSSLNNPVKRGIATAISWAMPRFRFYPPEQAKAAFEHLDLLTEVDLVWTKVLELQASLPPLETVGRCAAALGLRQPPAGSQVVGG